MAYVFLSIDTSAGDPADAVDDAKFGQTHGELIAYFRDTYGDCEADWVVEALEQDSGVDTGDNRYYIIKELS